MPLTKLNSALIDEGRMDAALNAAIKRVGAEVVKSWQDHGDISCAKGEIVLKILVAKDEKYQDYFGVTWDMVEKKPKLPKGNLSLATMEKGELVVQEAGGNSGNPKQESFAHEITVSEKGHENNKEAN